VTYEVIETETYTSWIAKLRDRAGRAVIGRRIQRVAEGNFGDVRPVGDRVSELRVNHGPGYRVYFVVRAAVVLVLLCGGDKDSQSRDVSRAKTLAKDVRG